MKLYSVTLLISLLFLISCKDKIGAPPPTADFFVTNSGCTAPCTLYFKDNSKHSADLYSWDFGNGETGNTKDTAIRYDYEGAYSVILSVFNESGEENTKMKTVNIGPAKIAKITQVTLQDISFTNPEGLNWDPTGYPDVFINIRKDVDIIWNGKGQTIDDVDPAKLPSTYPMLVNLDEYTAIYFLDIVDNDEPDPDELMFTFEFSPEDFNAGSQVYPTTLSLNSGSYQVTIQVEWEEP